MKKLILAMVAVLAVAGVVEGATIDTIAREVYVQTPSGSDSGSNSLPGSQFLLKFLSTNGDFVSAQVLSHVSGSGSEILGGGGSAGNYQGNGAGLGLFADALFQVSFSLAQSHTYSFDYSAVVEIQQDGDVPATASVKLTGPGGSSIIDYAVTGILAGSYGDVSGQQSSSGTLAPGSYEMTARATVGTKDTALFSDAYASFGGLRLILTPTGSGGGGGGTAVPLPASAWLCFAMLSGLGIVRRLRRRR